MAAVEPDPSATVPSSADQERLAAHIRDVPDYPEPGVTFKDITPLLADSDSFARLTGLLAETVRRHGATRVVGLEARGFILAAPAAVQARVGFLPVRKAGKLPGPTLSQSYRLEYGTAAMELRSGDLTPDDRVLVIDDVLATGGTAEAAMHLIRRTGAVVAGVSVLLELEFLNGRGRLQDTLRGAPLEAFLTA